MHVNKTLARKYSSNFPLIFRIPMKHTRTSPKSLPVPPLKERAQASEQYVSVPTAPLVAEKKDHLSPQSFGG